MNRNVDIRLEKMELINKTIVELYASNQTLQERITNFFHSFMNIVYFDRASLLFFRQEADGTYKKVSSISVNWNEKYVQDYSSYYCKLDDTLPALNQPYPIILRSSTFFNTELRQQTEYWKDYLVPNNSIYEVAANLQIPGKKGIRASYAFYRGSSCSDFTDDELCIIKMFQPHLSYILARESAPQSIKSVNTNFPMLEQHESVGICVLNDYFQPVHQSKMFQELNNKTNHSIMKHILHLCITLSQKKDGDSQKVLSFKPEDMPYFLEVAEMPSENNSDQKMYCCMAYNLSHFIARTLEQAQKTYHLTAREYDILLKVMKGQKNEAIAKDLYLSVPSVKKNLASVYSKLEITNQKQIFNKLHMF